MPNNPLTELVGEGRCATCGFLVHLLHYTTARATNAPKIVQSITSSDILEVQIFMRASGDQFGGSYPDPKGVHWSWAAPLCFVYAAKPSLAEEVGFDAKSASTLDRATVATAIQRDRQCAEWFEWRPGISPEEHVRMRDVIRHEDQRRDWETKQENDRRVFEGKLTRNQIVAGVTAAVVSIAAAVLLTYITITFTQPDEAPNPQPVIVVTPTAVTIQEP